VTVISTMSERMWRQCDIHVILLHLSSLFTPRTPNLGRHQKERNYSCAGSPVPFSCIHRRAMRRLRKPPISHGSDFFDRQMRKAPSFLDFHRPRISFPGHPPS
jgi:hypothetical protein